MNLVIEEKHNILNNSVLRKSGWVEMAHPDLYKRLYINVLYYHVLI